MNGNVFNMVISSLPILPVYNREKILLDCMSMMKWVDTPFITVCLVMGDVDPFNIYIRYDSPEYVKINEYKDKIFTKEVLDKFVESVESIKTVGPITDTEYSILVDESIKYFKKRFPYSKNIERLTPLIGNMPNYSYLPYIDYAYKETGRKICYYIDGGLNDWLRK